MRKRQDRHALQRCAEIRALQVLAAEAEAARAEAQLLKEKQELARRRDELEKSQRNWQQAVSQPVLKLETVPLWQTVVVRHEDQFESAQDTAQRAASQRDAAVAGVHAAQQRSDVADQLAARAVARHRQRLEEMALNDAADRHLQGRES